jgi:hypothetical protein
MALVIEDGTLVAGANSYVTTGEARTYAAKRGVTFVSGTSYPASRATLSGLPSGYNSILEAKVAGLNGNETSLQLSGDSVPAAGVTVTILANAVQVHYEVDVSTVADVDNALTAEFNIVTPGTSSRILTADMAWSSPILFTGGIDAGVNEPALEILLTKAIDYLEQVRDRYRGTKVSGTQALQWPRIDVQVDSFDIAIDVIPQLLKDAQCQLAIELLTTDDLLPTRLASPVKKEKVDVIETEYAVGEGTYSPLPKLTKVEALLTPLFRFGNRLQLIRI